MRSELLLAIDTARGDLETELAALDRISSAQADGAQSEARGQLRSLKSLRDQLVGGAKNLPALRAEITAAVAAIHAYASELQGAASAAQNSASTQAQFQQANADARRVVNDVAGDLFERRIFDPYLRFSSQVDEEEYRRRESEHERAVRAAQAENTPQGNLRALDLTIEQMKDAGAHGANASPDYAPRMKALKESRQHLEQALVAKTATASDQETSASLELQSVDADTVASKPGDFDRAVANLRAAGVATVASNARAPVVQSLRGTDAPIKGMG